MHSGLSVLIDSIEISGTQVIISITVTNQDQSNLLIPDIDKMGSNLFHFFTNGLSLRDQAYDEVFHSNIEHQTPSPWNSWETDWLSELKSGDSRQFNINYTINSPINPGEYTASFSFPGLSFQVTKDKLYKDNGRVWLGSVRATKRILIP